MLPMPAFFIEHQSALLFYAILIFLIVMFRKKIEWQTFGIGLYKTKVGLKLMDSWGKKYRGLVQLLGYIGLGVGFVGMVAIVYVLLRGFFDMIGNPEAPPVVSPVIPGFSIWGHDLKVPLITGWLALFVVIVIHEFSHGVVSRAHNIKIKSSGLLIFGPLGGAFVEPDEKKLPKQDPAIQYSMFAAGPWSNILSGLVFMMVVTVVAKGVLFMTVPAGVEIDSTVDGYPAELAGIEEGMIVTSINGQIVESNIDMTDALAPVGIGEEVTAGTKEHGEFVLQTAQNPDETIENGYIGVKLTPTGYREPKIAALWYAVPHKILAWLQEFFYWIVLLSFGIGLANLLPIGPIDGGRMVQTAARQITGDEKRGDWWWKRISFFSLALLVILLVLPIIRSVV